MTAQQASASIIRDLTAALVAARPYVATCADSAADDAGKTVDQIDRALKSTALFYAAAAEGK
jgi:hypothetical protein